MSSKCYVTELLIFIPSRHAVSYGRNVKVFQYFKALSLGKTTVIPKNNFISIHLLEKCNFLVIFCNTHVCFLNLTCNS